MRRQNACRQFFFVFFVEVRDDLPDDLGGLIADIAFFIDQKLGQEAKGHQLLLFRHIGRILAQNGNIGTQVLPVFFAARGFDQIREILLIVEFVHQADIMCDGKIFEFTDHRRAFQKRVVGRLHRGRLRGETARHRRQIDADAERFQIGFEILQLVVDFAVTVLFGGVHVVQLVQDHVKGFCQRVKVDDLRTVGIAAAFYPKIRIDQEQGLGGQIVQFQIPSGVIGSDMPDHRHTEAVKTEIGIVVVQIRDPLFFAFFAAVFADVVPGGSAGDQAQIDRDLQSRELSGRMHGDIVYAGDMSQRIERCQLNAQTHKFVNIMAGSRTQELAVFAAPGVLLALLRRQRHKIDRRIERKGLPFIPVQRFQKLQQEQTRGSLRRRFGASGRFFREKAVKHPLIGVLQPSLFRRFAEAV